MNSRHLLLLTLLPPIAAHMSLTSPPALRSKLNPHTTPANIDYSLTSPLRADGADYPCKGSLGLLGTADGAAVATWTAGAAYRFVVAGGATHGGGSCQAALSVDGGRSFRVLASFEGACPVAGAAESGFVVRVPRDVPATEGAVFAWTWFNRVGNREMYMNCAVVDVVGADLGDGERVGFAERPGLLRANIGGPCRTVEGVDIQFPEPGPDVVSSGAVSLPAGDCGGGGGGDAGSGANYNSGTSQGSPSVSTTPYTTPPHPLPCTETTTSSIDLGKGYTPGNDWPEWFQSAAPTVSAAIVLNTWLWAAFLAFCLV
ncbi:lytic polysaccharide monooxygenase [Trichocladium antarcticum]|uniref:Lytic polysaccharide monooxygenase n=1 Tax=Trichocladium antarcticum TaxID=1450529 RepID=A0AAN6UV35_9PEZI|nr:lytic polysaccharide monooxygenase [Trichocladium antarcticum]